MQLLLQSMRCLNALDFVTVVVVEAVVVEGRLAVLYSGIRTICVCYSGCH